MGYLHVGGMGRPLDRRPMSTVPSYWSPLRNRANALCFTKSNIGPSAGNLSTILRFLRSSNESIEALKSRLRLSSCTLSGSTPAAASQRRDLA